MRKQKIFEVIWAGYIENSYKNDWIVAADYADAEKLARATFSGLTNIKAIHDTQRQVYALKAD